MMTVYRSVHVYREKPTDNTDSRSCHGHCNDTHAQETHQETRQSIDRSQINPAQSHPSGRIQAHSESRQHCLDNTALTCRVSCEEISAGLKARLMTHTSLKEGYGLCAKQTASLIRLHTTMPAMCLKRREARAWK